MKNLKGWKMNEIQTLNNLVTEIKFFEDAAVKSYWEIGKRLAQAKEQVGYGKWDAWLQSNLNYTKSMADKLIKVSEEIKDSQLIAKLNFTQMLALTTVDEETRNEIIENENLEDKTVKETQEIIKKYKEKAEDLEEENQGLKLANQELTSIIDKQETKVIEKEVIREVKPSDYEEIKRMNKLLQDKNNELELKARLSKLNDTEENEKLKSELRNYKWLVLNFVKNATPLLNVVGQIKILPKSEQELFKTSSENLLGFATNLYDQTKGI